MLVALVLANTSCNDDYLNVSSPSAVDQDFVFLSPNEAYKVMVGCYDIWRSTPGGLFYDIDEVGSDAETHPESYDAQTRHIPEGLYASEISIDYANFVNIWASLYKVANRSNMIMEAIELKPDYQAAVTAGKASEWSHLYGEAAVFRAYAYFTLIRYFGDVPYFDKSIISNIVFDGLCKSFVLITFSLFLKA